MNSNFCNGSATTLFTMTAVMDIIFANDWTPTDVLMFLPVGLYTTSVHEHHNHNSLWHDEVTQRMNVIGFFYHRSSEEGA